MRCAGALSFLEGIRGIRGIRDIRESGEEFDFSDSSDGSDFRLLSLGDDTALSFKTKIETNLPLPGSFRIG